MGRPGRLRLDDVSLRLSSGCVTALLGANGAGKTTLLRVLAGAQAVDAGAVTIDDALLHRLGAPALARRRAVLSQHPGAASGLAVRDIVALGRLMFRHTPEQRHDRAAIAATRSGFGLEPLWERGADTLSGGQHQRVQLARVAAQLWRPDGRMQGLALFLDEPTASLDLAQQQAALGFARRCAAAGAAVLAVLHDPNHALAADQVALLRDGRLLAAGPTDEVMTSELLSACLQVSLQRAYKSDGGLVLAL